MDYLDREKAKRHAKQQAEQMYDQNYSNRDIGGGGGGNWGNVGQQYGMGGGYGMQQGESSPIYRFCILQQLYTAYLTPGMMSAHLPSTHYMAVAATSNSCRLVSSYVMLSCNICHA